MTIINKLKCLAVDMPPRIKSWLCWAFVVCSVLALAFYFAAFMYFRTGNWLKSGDSELCLWYSMASDMIRTFPHCGVIRFNYCRGVVDLMLNVFAVLVGGVSIWKACWTYAFFNALTSVGIAILVSLRQEDGRVRFSVLRFAVACLFQASFYYFNVGHISSFLLAVLCMWSFVWEFKRKWIQHVMLVFCCLFGVLNDDMFCIVFACPIITLFLIRFLMGSSMDCRLLSVVAGTVLGFATVKCCLAANIIWQPHFTHALVNMNDLGQWFVDMSASYAKVFRLDEGLGQELKAWSLFRFISSSGVIVLCVWFFVTELKRCVRLRFSKSVEVSSWAIFVVLFLFVSYCFIDVKTKHLGVPVPRYVYFGTLALMALLVNGSFQSRVTKQFKCSVVLLAFLSLFISVNDDVVSRLGNTKSRKYLYATVNELLAAGVSTVYTDYWTAYALAVASKGKLSSACVIYGKKDRLVRHGLTMVDASYDAECYVYVRPKKQKTARRVFSPEENLRGAINTFGQPSRTVQIDDVYEIMFYDKNLAPCLPPLPNKAK